MRSVLGGDRGARLLVPGRDGAFLLVGADDVDVVARALTDGTRSVADVEEARAAVEVPGDVDAVLGAVALRGAVFVSRPARPGPVPGAERGERAHRDGPGSRARTRVMWSVLR